MGLDDGQVERSGTGERRTGQHDQVDVDHVGEGLGGRGDGTGRPRQELLCDGLTRPGEPRQRREVLDDAEARQGQAPRPGRGDQGRRRRHRLDAAARAAPTGEAVEVDAGVADLAGVPTHPPVHDAVDHEPGTDPGSHVERCEGAARPCGPRPVLAHGGGRRVVLDEHRQAGARLEGLGQRKVAPRLHDRRRERHPARTRERPRRDDAEPEQQRRVDPHVRHQAHHLGADALDHRCRRVGARAPTAQPAHDRAAEVGHDVADARVVKAHPEGEAGIGHEREQHRGLAAGRGGPTHLDHETVVDEGAYGCRHGRSVRAHPVDELDPADLTRPTDRVDQLAAVDGVGADAGVGAHGLPPS